AGSLAGCSNSGRFEVNNPFDPPKPTAALKPSSDVTGSVSSPAPASSNKIASTPLPAPTKPATVASAGLAQGAGGMGAYRPDGSHDITGSVKTARAPEPTGHWSWEGGTPVTVGADETAETIGRKYGVPTSAIMQANGLHNPGDIRPGQRIVIPRY